MSLPHSDDQLLLLHNPRCSKSRQVKALLEERGLEFEERQYLENPLTEDELKALGQSLERPVQQWTRSGQAEFAEAGLDQESGEEQVMAAMVKCPILMERPMLVRGRRAIVGRPPEAVLGLL